MYPLEGLKVIELARVLAGPWIGQTLADLGADVVKVESPEGDDTRDWGDNIVTKGNDESAAYFHSTNRGKQGITVNFNNSDQLAKLKSVIASADVLIENFKVGGLEKFGLDYKALSKKNPKLIYCSVTGFGQDGPRAHKAGYDFMIQGMSGIMDITGEPGGMPQKVGVAFADIFTGLYGVIGIQAALVQRARTGKGQHIDMALFDCMLAAQANQNLNYLISGESPQRMGNAHPSIVPYQVFPVSDGHIVIACGNNRQFHNLATALGRKEWIKNPIFYDNITRISNRIEVTSAITAELNNWEKLKILPVLEAAGVPSGPINTIAEALEDPQTLHRKMRISPEGIPGVRTPIKFSDSELQLVRAAPGLGEHNRD
ncbi:MAG: CaiB/BaiF CoA-transferase family protein, partial [Planktomarina sp.]|nr:CaiB/BaiF CoA-transferase family protein [Planktomarina sp.]